MDVTVINSKFSSLSFRKNWKAPFDEQEEYAQKFALNEEIRIQFKSDTIGFEAKYVDEIGNETPVNVLEIYTDGENYIYECLFSIPDAGVYEFILMNQWTEIVSVPLCIKTPEELQETVLLTYTHRENDFETIFEDRTFNFRVEGGIYPGNKTQSVENEIFRDQRFMPFQLSAKAYEVSVLTVGDTEGVPQWVGNRVNHIFCLSDVKVDGIHSTRNESSTPELVSISECYPKYVHTITIEQSDEEIHVGKDEYGNLVDTDGNFILTADSDYLFVKAV
jgi:hypothetical protein